MNTITPHNTTSKNATGMVASGFLVEVVKTHLDELRARYPMPSTGPIITGPASLSRD